MKNSQVSKTWEKVIQDNYGVPSIALVKGKGSEVYDIEGKKYLDIK